MATDSNASTRIGDIDFSTFVISLGRNAAMQLDATSKGYNVALAKQTIDILAMIEQKTAGNLTPEEAELLRDILYQTRLAWRDASRAAT